jgi:hypothetical protein
MVKFSLTFLVSLFLIVGLSGCGGSSSSSVDDNTTGGGDVITPVTTTGVIVDPYIVGAVLCEDLNKDGVCGDDEQVSTASTIDGEFTFSEELTAGSNVIIKTQGKHEGKTFDLNISGVVSVDKTIDVVSPLTTLETKGLTADQIAEILTNAGLAVSATDILSDPLSGGLMDKTSSQISESDLVNIQASIATYGLLRVMDGSSRLRELTNEELYYGAISEDGPIYPIVQAMVAGVKESLNAELLAMISNQMQYAQSGPFVPPAVTVDVIVKVGLVIMDRFATVGYSTCNATSGDDETKVTTALAQVALVRNDIVSQENITALGIKLYAMRNYSQIEILRNYQDHLPDISYINYLFDGLDDKDDGKETYRFNEANVLVSYSE